MLTILNSQIAELKEISISRFILKIKLLCSKEGINIPNDDKLREYILKAEGAGIVDSTNIVEYVKLAMKYKELQSTQKTIIKNILYINSSAEAKIAKLKEVLE